jgi:hypothetical protein
MAISRFELTGRNMSAKIKASQTDPQIKSADRSSPVIAFDSFGIAVSLIGFVVSPFGSGRSVVAHHVFV